MPLTADIERIEDKVQQHDERIMSLELSRAKFLGAMFVMSFLGSAGGALVMLALGKVLRP